MGWFWVVKGLDYSFIADQIAVNGEPGVFWIENARAFSRMSDKADFKDKKAAGVNPCGEQTLESFELCCLVETFVSRHDSYEEFQETLKYAYIYAKSVTLSAYEQRICRDICSSTLRASRASSILLLHVWTDFDFAK